ncbi:hypothetical protein [Streptomyces syringium]|uniref:hypothetical protein n=1 Tax=Streptomyces syringium TaxID=76729 RepID=UPI0033CA1536
MSTKDDNTPTDPAFYTAENLLEPIFGNFVKSEYDPLKKKVNDLSVTVNGLSVGVDSAKVAFAGFSGGGTLLKADFTGLKMDEKGITFMGRQLTTWSWAQSDSDRAESRASRAQTRLSNAQIAFNGSLANAQRSPTLINRLQLDHELKELEKARRDAGRAQIKIREIARDSAQKKKDSEANLKRASDAYKQVNKEISGLRRAVATLGRELAGGA